MFQVFIKGIKQLNMTHKFGKHCLFLLLLPHSGIVGGKGGHIQQRGAGCCGTISAAKLPSILYSNAGPSGRKQPRNSEDELRAFEWDSAYNSCPSLQGWISIPLLPRECWVNVIAFNSASLLCWLTVTQYHRALRTHVMHCSHCVEITLFSGHVSQTA